MDKLRLKQLIIEQQEYFKKVEGLIERDININSYLKGNEIILITGIRRCGKSSLLKLISNLFEKKVYINFDDIRFTDFNINDFQDLQELIVELYGEEINYFLDEIQNIPYWEKWVNNLYMNNKKVFLTGSNSNLLSSEISTFLTGRNKVIKLQPFSFKEFLNLKKIDYQSIITTSQKAKIKTAFQEYFSNGGFPLIIKNDDLDLSKQYFEDILNKDVLTRYKIKQIKEIKDLILYLLSNIGKTYSYSSLKRITGISSLSTIKNYIDYFKNVFLLNTITRFDYSIKKQKVSSSKVYTIDNSFLKTIAFNFSENLGRRLENLVFIDLIRREKEVYYHLGKKECDFVIKKGLKITQAIQVSKSLSNPLIEQRELQGLLEAMNKYKLTKGLILTQEEEKEIKIRDKIIIVKPIWHYLLED